MELLFLLILILLMASALGTGFPVAFALPGAAILTIGLATITGLIFVGDTDAFFHSGGPSQWLSSGVSNLRGVYWVVERDTLIAIPLFIFMGIMLQRSKIAEDLLVTMAQLFGPVPGGLGISVVFVGALLAATTGIVGATVVAMGLISLPAMLRNNYSPSLATGTIAASGTLGQIIPPSIVLIILADQLASATDQASSARKAMFKESTGELAMPSAFDVASTSAGEMFLGAFLPGMVLVGLYMAFILVLALIRPHLAPAVHYSGKFDLQFLLNVLLTLIPPLALIFMVLGSIISGIATVNQAGAIGAAGAMLMAGYRLTAGQKNSFYPAILAIVSLVMMALVLSNYEMNIKAASTPEDFEGIYLGAFASILLIISLVWSCWRVLRIDDTLRGVMLETAKTTSLVFIILLGAAMLTAAFRAFGGEELVRDFLNSLPGGFWSKFIIVMLVIFILGFFLDFIEIAVVVVPIVAPILLADPSANITAVWLGVMIGLNVQTSFLTPPFGFALFYLRGVAPAVVRTVQMYKGVIPFIALQLLALAIVGTYPQLVNYLPNRISMLSDTAPPPRNPKLQHCIEQSASKYFSKNGDQLKTSISMAQNINLANLPKNYAKPFAKAIKQVEDAPGLLAAAMTAESAVLAASDDYRVIHTQVRGIQREIRNIDTSSQELEQQLDQIGDDSPTRLREVLSEQLADMKTQKEQLQATIPADWDETYQAYSKLVKAERKARNDYRRNSDSAYDTVQLLKTTLGSAAQFSALESSLNTLASSVAEQPENKQLIEELAALSEQFSAIEGANKIRSEINKARKALKARTPSPAKANQSLEKAQNLYGEQKQWRLATATLLPAVEKFEQDIRHSIGLRSQRRMDRETSLYVASCRSTHRDISLNF